MLNIFADALLIATRMNGPHADQDAPRARPETAAPQQRRWLSLSGLRR